MVKRVIPWEESSSLMNDSTKAYIAGFLDGDGSIMLQIKPRIGVRYGYRIYATICFYQDAAHEKELRWILEQLGVGYVSKRNDDIAELRINGYERVEKVLLELRDHIRFKRQQLELMLDVLAMVKVRQAPEEFLEACKLADEISSLNYASRRKHTAESVEHYLRRERLLSP